MQRHSQASFSRNRLLSIIAPDDFARLRPSFQRVALKAKDVLEEPNEPFPYVYFLEPCVASVVALPEGGEGIEVALFGPEGMSGTAIIQGSDRSPLQTFVQVPGVAVRVPAAALASALDESQTLRSLLSRYVQAFSIQIAYTALANGRFGIEERLSRWLLMCHDRLDTDHPASHA